MGEASSLQWGIMKRGPLGFFVLLIGISGSAFSQGGYYGYPYEIPADPRSVAMGESFAGLPSNPAALMYNPAGLAGLNGAHISYSYRGLNWVPPTEEWGFYSFNAAVATSFGVFAARYDRKSLGTMPVTTLADPDGAGTKLNVYSHDIALGYALGLGRGFAVGVSAKYYDFVESVSGPSSSPSTPGSTTPAYLFDIGLTYTLPRLHSQANIEDSLTVGMSYQNIGTSWKVGTANPTITTESELAQQEVALPQYFRLGLSYTMRVVPADPGGLSPLGVIIAGEFQSVQSSSTPYYSVPWRTGDSFWGLGVECTGFEILSLRAGWSLKPGSDFEGEGGKGALRYGAAVRMPLRRIGVDAPFLVSFEYAVIPLYRLNYWAQIGGEKSSVPVFSIGISYTGYPW